MLSMSQEEQTPKSPGETARSGPPDPEVRAKPKRRTFTADYKRRILAEVDACTEKGGIGEILRREGLYSSHLTDWRRGRERGLEPRKRGRKRAPLTAASERVAELEKENRRLQRERDLLQARLKRADLMLDLQKKASEILGFQFPELPNDETSA